MTFIEESIQKLKQNKKKLRGKWENCRVGVKAAGGCDVMWCDGYVGSVAGKCIH